MDGYLIEENARIAREQPAQAQTCVAAMLYACQQNELNTIREYTNVKQRICEIVGEDKQNNTLCNMLCSMIEECESRAASFGKAAALLMGRAAPKPIQYDKAVKND